MHLPLLAMNTRLLTTPLLAAGLLLSTLGCSKKDETPAPLGTGSYKLDNQVVTCQARASTSAGTSGSTPLYFVTVYLSTTPTPAGGQQQLQLTYFRSNPSVPYQFSNALLFEKGTATLAGEFTGASGTATANSDGSFSGTFVAQATGTLPTPYKEITAGSFANARP